MTKEEVKVKLFSLFAEDNALPMRSIPMSIQTAAKNMSHQERIMAVKEAGAKELVTNLSKPHFDKINRSIQIFPVERQDVEFFGNWIQIIGAACIHTNDHILMLRLTEDTMVDGYVTDTLTYPQGHCIYDNEFIRASIGQRAEKWSYDALIKKVKENIYREITEEIGVAIEHQEVTLFNEIHERLFRMPGSGKIYPIYVDKPGTARKHICLLADINMDQTSLEQVRYNLRSKEDEKHVVMFLGFDNLLRMPRVDNICPWVAKSFSLLPFMRESFIAPYLRKAQS